MIDTDRYVVDVMNRIDVDVWQVYHMLCHDVHSILWGCIVGYTRLQQKQRGTVDNEKEGLMVGRRRV